MNQRFTIGFVFTVFFFFLFSAFYFIEKKSNPRMEQTVPEDMLFIEGNDSIMSYYIGKTEETNYNWQVYLAWLKHVFGADNPSVVHGAMPHDTVEGLWQYYNDPVLNNYSTHPSYQSYPVTGVTWLQIQDYLTWKTDRLNEMILIKNRILKFDPDQQNEGNFNTETYFEMQYEGKSIESGQLRNFNPHEKKTRRVRPSDGILFPEYRLPTEAEWDCANEISKQSVDKNQHFLTGKNYFLNDWGKLFSISNNDKMKNKSIEYNLATGFEAGVMEWLIDLKDSKSKSKENNYDQYIRNGFKSFNFYGNTLDQDGYIIEKDSVGKLPFIYTGVSNVGTANYATSYKLIYRSCAIVFLANPFFGKELLLTEYCRTSNLYYDSAFKAYKQLNPNNQYSTQAFTNRCNKSPYDSTIYFTGIYNGNYVYFSTSDSLYKAGVTCQYIKNETQNRKVKSGNFKKQSNKTDYKNENESDPFLGFRCVLPSTGVACPEKYKVEW